VVLASTTISVENRRIMGVPWRSFFSRGRDLDVAAIMSTFRMVIRIVCVNLDAEALEHETEQKPACDVDLEVDAGVLHEPPPQTPHCASNPNHQTRWSASASGTSRFGQSHEQVGLRSTNGSVSEPERSRRR